MPSEVLCYNKGCGKTFDPEVNAAEACIHHPGVPVFHDALKGWSCCKRRTTDFSDFLNIPGCTKGSHSSEKPAEPVAPKVTSSKSKDLPDPKVLEKLMESAVKPMPTPEPTERPCSSEPLVALPIKVTASLQNALKKLTLQQDDAADASEATRPKVCRNKACGKTYTETIDETCIYHSGFPIFHEGMKYWSCCQRKTSDFANFMAQQGCCQGAHDWKLKSLVETAPCRYDWHQTGSVVVVSVFAKTAIKENCSFKTNQVYADFDIEFEGGKRNFQLEIELEGVIDPSRSFVTLYGTKVEITLKKASAHHWKRLFIPKAVAEEASDEADKEREEEHSKKVENVQQTAKNNKAAEDEDSDLSGIDDVEFD